MLSLACLNEEGCELTLGLQAEPELRSVHSSRPPWYVSSKLALRAALCNFPGVIITQSSLPFLPLSNLSSLQYLPPGPFL